LVESRGNLPAGKGRVQKFKNSFELIEQLPPRALKILKALGAENSQTTVARIAECTKSNITYWKDKLLTMGALKIVSRGATNIFQLTPFGSKIITRSEGYFPEVCCLEDHAVKFRVLGWERVPLDWKRLGRPRNWEKLGVRIGNVRVVRTSKRIIVHPGRLRGFDVDELLMLSGRIVERVRMVLENKFGMVLSDVGVPLHQPVTRFYSEEARELVKLGTTIVQDVGSIDESPPEKVPHEEYVGKDLAKARLLMPLNVRRLERRVGDVEEKVDKLSGEVHELVSVLKEALIGRGKVSPSQPLKDGRYIT